MALEDADKDEVKDIITEALKTFKPETTEDETGETVVTAAEIPVPNPPKTNEEVEEEARIEAEKSIPDKIVETVPQLSIFQKIWEAIW